MALQALEQAVQCGAVPGTQNPFEDLSVPRAVSHAMQPETTNVRNTVLVLPVYVC